MKTEVAIIGGGPAGTASAMFLAEKGISSVIIEKEGFPRYHIGESMTGECGALVRALGLEQAMLDRGFPIKRGVAVYGAGGKNRWHVSVMNRNEAGEMVPSFTWQVRRSEFDKMMMDEARARGIEVIDGRASQPILSNEGNVTGVTIRRSGGASLSIESDVLLDASGQTTFLANHGVTGSKRRGNYDRQIAIFSQVADTLRDEGDQHSDTLIFYRSKNHWAWFIPLDDGVVSVGVVVPAAYYLAKGEDKPSFLARELRELNPELSDRIPISHFVEEVKAVVNYSYQVSKFAGHGYIAVGDAHRFVDPIFSFGLFVAMKEAHFAAGAIHNYIGANRNGNHDPFADYMRKTEMGQDIVEDLVDAFWEHPLAFALFVHERYRHDMIDALAGRIYDEAPSQVVQSLRGLLNRDRDYADLTRISVPIGSRFDENQVKENIKAEL